jgi:hypothetical protein
MYQKPVLEKFGHFRDLTRLGLSSSTDGFSVIGIGTSPGCQTTWRWGSHGGTVEYGCPEEQGTS